VAFNPERDEDFTEEAADATEEARRAAGDEERTIEEQVDPLSVEEGDEEISDY
jgi:hypothetical protein